MLHTRFEEIIEVIAGAATRSGTILRQRGT
jgi:hypothetical protein